MAKYDHYDHIKRVEDKLEKQGHILNGRYHRGAADHRTSGDDPESTAISYKHKDTGKTHEVVVASPAYKKLMKQPHNSGHGETIMEHIDPVEQAIVNVLDNNLDDMRTNVYQALSMLAAERLQEKKIEIADSYFGQK